MAFDFPREALLPSEPWVVAPLAKTTTLLYSVNNTSENSNNFSVGIDNVLLLDCRCCFCYRQVFATVVILRVALMVVLGPHTMNYYDVDDEDVYISCGVGVKFLLEGVGESP